MCYMSRKHAGCPHDGEVAEWSKAPTARQAGPIQVRKGVRFSSTSGENRVIKHDGEVAEWSKAHAWNACRRVTVSRVRIPVSPPLLILSRVFPDDLTSLFLGLDFQSLAIKNWKKDLAVRGYVRMPSA